MRSITTAAFAIAMAAALQAQQLSESIEVRVTNVDVVVTDRAGNPIHGLTRADFQLFENGKAQPITNFYEVAVEGTTEPAIAGEARVPERAASDSMAPRTESRQRSLVIFIDNSAIDPLRRNQAFTAVTNAIDRIMRDGDDAAIATWSHELHIVQPFTSDRQKIKSSLDAQRRIVSAVGNKAFERNQVISYADSLLDSVRHGIMTRAQAYAAATSRARDYAESVRHTQRAMMKSLSEATSLLGGIDGRKVLLFVGGDLEERPGLDVFQLVNARFAASSAPVITESDLNLTAELREVTRSANGNGVTLYTIDVADRTRDATEGSMQNAPDPEVEFTKTANTYLSIGRLAWDTGGTVLSGTSNFAVALNNIARDLGSYYSLGYKPREEGGAERTISVKVNRPGAVVRTRHTYALKSTEESVADRVIANAFHTTLKSDFPVAIEVAKPEKYKRGLYLVRVTVTFPSELTFVPDGSDLSGEYAIYFVTTTKDGAVSPVGKQGGPVKFPAASASAIKSKPFTHTTGLIVREGEQSISVAVLDRLGARVGYARAVVNVQ